MFLRMLFLLLLAIASRAGAQSIRGRIVGTRQQPLPFVSVTLHKDSQVVASAITDDSGYFRLATALIKHEKYEMDFSLVGYQSHHISLVYSDTLNPLLIALDEDRTLLSGVTVTGSVNLITRKSDRYIVNVEKGAMANGLSATEVLQRSPGVWVDNMGNIRLKGNQPVTIMINDVVQRMDTEELADFMRSLKSEDISRIEIIPSPPSEFEAGGSGGIVHIVLKKEKRSGWSGNINAQYWQQGRRPYTTAGATLNYQFRKLYLSGSYNYTYDRRVITERTIITYPDHSAFENATDRSEKIKRQQYRLSAVYDFNAKHSVSMYSAFSRTGFRHLFQSNEWYYAASVPSGIATSVKQRLFDMAGATLGYTFKPDTLGSLMKVIVDFLQTDRHERNEFARISNSLPSRRFWRTTAPIDTRIYSLQGDYSRKLKKQITLQSGIKLTSIARNNQLVTEDLADTAWQFNSAQSSHFLYTENILMLYASLEHTFNHSTIKGGLRAEETFSQGNETNIAIKFSRKYFGLFPSISFMQLLNKATGTAVTASYSRRLTRPALNELNPARLEFSSYTAVTGNSNLLPQYSHHFSLSWQFFKHHSAEAYFVRTNNFIALSANPGSNNAIDYTFENTGATTEYGLTYSSNIRPFAIWSIATNLAVYRAAYQFNDRPYRQTSLYASSIHSLTLAKLAELDCMVDYRSPYIYTNLYTYGNFSMDAGITKKLFKAKGRIRLSITDILNTSREKEWTEDKGGTISFYRKRPTRTVRLSFTYQFSSGKNMQNKKIEQGSAEDKGRIGN